MHRIKRYILMLIILIKKGGYKRARYLKKIGYFKRQGDHCFFQPFNFGSEPYLISFGNNVHVASKVTFITHDVTSLMYNYMDDSNNYKMRYGDICVGNNVFIGSNSTILYNVKIGNNVIIGAGSLINKDVPDGVVVAGVPGKVVGSFDNYKEKILSGDM